MSTRIGLSRSPKMRFAMGSGEANGADLRGEAKMRLKLGSMLILSAAVFSLCGCLTGCSGETGARGGVFAPPQLDASTGPAGAEEQISYIVGNAGQALPVEERPSRVMQLGVDAGAGVAAQEALHMQEWTNYFYDESGRLVKTATFGETVLANTTSSYEYDADGRLLSARVQTDDGDIASLDYVYERGRLAKAEATTCKGGESSGSSVETYSYDDDACALTVDRYYADGALKETLVVRFDANHPWEGNPLDYDGGRMISTDGYTAEGEMKQHDEFVYNEDGTPSLKTIQVLPVDGGGESYSERAYAYDENGFETYVTFKQTLADVHQAYRIERTFGAGGRMTQKIERSNMGDEVRTYARDERGRVVASKCVSGLAPIAWYPSLTVYQYDLGLTEASSSEEGMEEAASQYESDRLRESYLDLAAVYVAGSYQARSGSMYDGSQPVLELHVDGSGTFDGVSGRWEWDDTARAVYAYTGGEAPAWYVWGQEAGYPSGQRLGDGAFAEFDRVRDENGVPID